MPDPVPVGASYSVATQLMTVTFDERIVAETVNVGQFVLEGVDATRRHNQPFGTVVGRRVTWGTAGILGANLPPPRVTYAATVGTIDGKSGGTVQAFANFPVTLI